MNVKSLLKVSIATAVVLAVAGLVNILSDEFVWNLADYLVAGALLFAAGLVFELVASKVDKRHRLIVALTILALVSLIWIELAVGIFD